MLIVGPQIGAGIGRRVHECNMNDDWVLKFETSSGSFQNIMEWETWQEVEDCEYAEHFAPCEYISPNGVILIQRRTRPVVKEMLPKRMPAFFCDFKPDNFGLLDGKLVCHDYGYSRLLTQGLSKKMRNADWWE